MKIGMTGTRLGMTEYQKACFKDWLQVKSKQPIEAHHGDCVGSDKEFHDIMKDIGASIIIHPPTDSKLRAFCAGETVLLQPQPYIERNHSIVNSVDIMVAFPDTKQEKLRSGTWSTIRYAGKKGVKLVIFPPSI